MDLPFSSLSSTVFHVIGGGLAGSEAAWQLLRMGHKVRLHEMRPVKQTPAHQSVDLAELVCSNSFKAFALDTVSGLLKKEMQDLDSLIISEAFKAKVPAGGALAVDRRLFSEGVMSRLQSMPGFELIREELTSLPSFEELSDRNEIYILATGPLTSDPLANSLRELTAQQEDLYFYDAIAPVLLADSIDLTQVFFADRWANTGRSLLEDDGDYLNIALDQEQYLAFIEDVQQAEKMPLHDFEEPKYFESCLPIEVMAERGVDTLRFGPMKPVGLIDPKSGKRPYANIQLRKENNEATMYSMVGFQTKMKWPEQKRVFSKIPGLQNAEFLRFGSVHRNTYVNSPKVLHSNLSIKAHPRVFLAGQITGVEGYTESAAIGLLAGRFAGSKDFKAPPTSTVMGALLSYVTCGPLGPFTPMNANLGLLPKPDLGEKGLKKINKSERKHMQLDRAKKDFEVFRSCVCSELLMSPDL